MAGMGIARSMAVQGEDGIKLSNADTLRFIELYKQHQLLWNLELPDHTNKARRTECLVKIAQMMGLNWNEQRMKDKIISLRSRYSKELVKVRVSRSTPNATPYRPVWKFFPMLDAFLRPFCTTRKTDTPVVRAFLDGQKRHQPDGSEQYPSNAATNYGTQPGPSLSGSCLMQPRPSNTQSQPMTNTGYRTGSAQSVGMHYQPNVVYEDDEVQVLEAEPDMDAQEPMYIEDDEAGVDSGLGVSFDYQEYSSGDTDAQAETRNDHERAKRRLQRKEQESNSSNNPSNTPEKDHKLLFDVPTPLLMQESRRKQRRRSPQNGHTAETESDSTGGSALSDGYVSPASDHVSSSFAQRIASWEASEEEQYLRKRNKRIKIEKDDDDHWNAGHDTPAATHEINGQSSLSFTNVKAKDGLSTVVTFPREDKVPGNASTGKAANLGETSQTHSIQLAVNEATNVMTSQMTGLLQSLVTQLSERPSHPQHEEDSELAFGRYIACELKKLDDEQRAEAKFNIQKIIYDALKNKTVQPVAQCADDDDDASGINQV